MHSFPPAEGLLDSRFLNFRSRECGFVVSAWIREPSIRGIDARALTAYRHRRLNERKRPRESEKDRSYFRQEGRFAMQEKFG